MKTSGKLVLGILAGSFVYAQSPAVTASVNVVPVPPVAGLGVGRLQGINQSNQAAGYSLGGDEAEGFMYSNGSLTPIKPQNGVGVQAYGIENNGRVVGKYYEYLPVTKNVIKTHGFLYFHGNITNIDYPGADITIARGINDPQRVVGHYKGSDGHNHGFYLDKNSYTSYDVPGAPDTFLMGINNPGDMVGYYIDPNADSNGDHHNHGFLYDKKGNLTTIDVQISGVTVTDTSCYGINSSGTIVGAYTDSAGITHGFVRVNGVFTSVDAPNLPPGVGTSVNGINDNGTLTLNGGANALVGTVAQ